MRPELRGEIADEYGSLEAGIDAIDSPEHQAYWDDSFVVLPPGTRYIDRVAWVYRAIRHDRKRNVHPPAGERQRGGRPRKKHPGVALREAARLLTNQRPPNLSAAARAATAKARDVLDAYELEEKKWDMGFLFDDARRAERCAQRAATAGAVGARAGQG